MKRFISFLLSVSSLFCSSVIYGQDTGTIVPKFLIDGHFFKNRPEAFPDSYESAFPQLQDKDGNKVFCIRYLDGNTLSEWSKERAIPIEKVKNGEQLLELARTARYLKTVEKGKPQIVKGDVFPSFKAIDITGRKWNSKDLQGKCFLINFWNTGCGPCIGEMPAISKWKEKYPGIMFFSATYNTAEQALPVIERRKFSYIHLVDIDEPLLSLVGTGGFPLTVIVNSNGNVVHVESGTTPKQLYDLEETLKKMKKE